MAHINRGDRTINTGGGNYNAHISGNYVEKIDGDVVEGSDTNKDKQKTQESGNGKNFVENLGGKQVNRWF